VGPRAVLDAVVKRKILKVSIPGGRLGIFLFSTASSPAQHSPAQPPIQWVPEILSLGVKRPWHEADHSPPSSAEVKECVELYLYSPSTSSLRGAQLNYRDNLIFTLPARNRTPIVQPVA
jgi:hypothetical protein